jgi:hypothetical protein
LENENLRIDEDMLKVKGAFLDGEVADYILRLKAERYEKCDKKNDPRLLLICDGCELMWHVRCVGLHDVPDGDWFCENCIKDGTAQIDRKEKAIAEKEAKLKKATMQGLDEDVTAGVGQGNDEEIDAEDEDEELRNAEIEEGEGEDLSAYDKLQSESSSSEKDSDESSDEGDGYYTNEKPTDAGEEKL